MQKPHPTLTRHGAHQGMRLALPLTPGILLAGAIYGAACRTLDVSQSEAVLKSTIVAAGTAQFAAAELWMRPVPVGSVTLITLVINLRYILMGTALPADFSRLPAGNRSMVAFFLCDESWALATRQCRIGKPDAGVIVGSGAIVYATWLAGTVLGFVSVSGLSIGAFPGVSFIVPAALLAVLAGFWAGPRTSLIPWAASAGVAVLCASMLPGSWYVVAGGITGMLVGGLLDVP